MKSTATSQKSPAGTSSSALDFKQPHAPTPVPSPGLSSPPPPPRNYPKIFVFRERLWPFDPHRIRFSDPERTAHGSYVVNETYHLVDEKEGINEMLPITIQTPVMRTPFGKSEKEHDGKVGASIELCFGNESSRPQKVQDFYDVIALWDQLTLKTAMKNRATWFKGSQNLSDEVLTYLYNSMIRKNIRVKDQKEFPESFRMVLPRRYDRIETEAFDHNRKAISLSDIQANDRVSALFTHGGLWFTAKMFSSSKRALQLKKAESTVIKGYGFVPEEGDERMASPQQGAEPISTFVDEEVD